MLHHTPPALLKIKDMIHSLGIDCVLVEQEGSIVINDKEKGHIVISLAADYWVYLTTWRLTDLPIKDDNQYRNLFYRLLRENDYTKMGRFYIDQDDYVCFAVDLRLEEISPSLLNEAINLIFYIYKDKFFDVFCDSRDLFIFSSDK